jgi:hypothetical protein
MSQNIETVMRDGKLIISIDTSVKLGPSKTGKTEMVATSRGVINLEDGLQLNLNLYRKRKGG